MANKSKGAVYLFRVHECLCQFEMEGVGENIFRGIFRKGEKVIQSVRKTFQL